MREFIAKNLKAKKSATTQLIIHLQGPKEID
jgi:hypothetical protein